jgi:hypothetical protein
VLFHVTAASRLPSIRRHGLKPGCKPQWTNAFGVPQGSRKLLYVMTDFAQAVRFAHRMQWEGKEPAVILAVDAAPALEADDHWENSAHGGCWWTTQERVPAAAVVREVALEPWLVRRVVKGLVEWPPVPDALDRLDGEAVWARLNDLDLDSEDVGDFCDRFFGEEDADEDKLLACADAANTARDAARAEALPGGRFRVWRSVVVADPAAWALDPRGAPGGGLGLCWSSSPDGAAPYSGPRRGHACVIVGEVGLDDVDWAATAIMRAVKPGQSELRLRPEGAVAVLGLATGHGEPLETPWAGRTATAGAADPRADLGLLAAGGVR